MSSQLTALESQTTLVDLARGPSMLPTSPPPPSGRRTPRTPVDTEMASPRPTRRRRPQDKKASHKSPLSAILGSPLEKSLRRPMPGLGQVLPADVQATLKEKNPIYRVLPNLVSYRHGPPAEMQSPKSPAYRNNQPQGAKYVIPLDLQWPLNFEAPKSENFRELCPELVEIPLPLLNLQIVEQSANFRQGLSSTDFTKPGYHFYRGAKIPYAVDMPYVSAQAGAIPPTNAVCLYDRNLKRQEIYPVHSLVLLSNFARLAVKPTQLEGEVNMTNQTIRLPVIPIYVAHLPSFVVLYRYIYDKNIGDLYRNLLRVDAETLPNDFLALNDIERMMFIRNYIHRSVTPHQALGLMHFVRGLFQNVCVVGFNEDALVQAITIVWRALFISLTTYPVPIPPIQIIEMPRCVLSGMDLDAAKQDMLPEGYQQGEDEQTVKDDSSDIGEVDEQEKLDSFADLSGESQASNMADVESGNSSVEVPEGSTGKSEQQAGPSSSSSRS